MRYNPSEDAPFEVYGLVADSKHFATASYAHRHNEIEYIFVMGGSMTFIFGGAHLRLERGSCAAFWAIVPHLAYESDEDAVLCWVKIPLRQFLEWQLPDDFVQALLLGKFISDPDPRQEHVSSAQFQSWHEYLARESSEAKKIVLLEVEARLRELALHLEAGISATGDAGAEHRDSGNASQVDQMITFISNNYQSLITIADIAAACNLQPNYAMRVFRARVGMSIMTYVNQHRISRAQRMLVTTDASVLDILLEAGFGSVTQFYTIFKQHCGCTPVDYRRSMRGII